MKYDKDYLRKKSLLKRKKEYLNKKKFNFNLIFNLIKKHFNKKKIIIAGYYPSNYEVNILKFVEEAYKKKFKITLPVIKSSNQMSFKLWAFNDPLYVNKFGMLEPKKSKRSFIPDLIIVPLVAFDNNLNRIGYGKGYYDRSLGKIKKIKKKTISLGVAYSFQKCKKIPVNKYDFKLNYIFTEKGIIKSN
ncbi:MAG: 5-formyltetrahydrofolate cyclo-ligase [Candidatus Pelagibacterales bacterium]|nr:MAG: 5-formyltetrahydrofolate cyclo-ligase [Pelagibacterales bacterium]